jgi:hypothetical protein
VREATWDEIEREFRQFEAQGGFEAATEVMVGAGRTKRRPVIGLEQARAARDGMGFGEAVAGIAAPAHSRRGESDEEADDQEQFHGNASVTF